MAKKWQLRTWTKGTGATVEPLGAQDRPAAKARPGGLPEHASRPAGERPRQGSGAAPGEHRTDAAARRTRALRHMDPELVAKLERLERALADAESQSSPPAAGGAGAEGGSADTPTLPR
jgi:hypothetical protein